MVLEPESDGIKLFNIILVLVVLVVGFVDEL